MAPRPHDADEPAPDRDEADRPASDDAPADAAEGPGTDAVAPAGEPGPDAGDDAAAVPGPIDPAEVDARWLEIVAELGDLSPPAPPTTPRRRSTDLPPGPAAPVPPPRGAEPPEPTGPRAWSPDPDLEEAENHFVPPDPGPVLGGDPLLTMAWAVAVGAPLVVVLSVILWRQGVPAIVLQVAGVAFLAAVGLLLWRMPHDQDDEDRSGPGAVV